MRVWRPWVWRWEGYIGEEVLVPLNYIIGRWLCRHQGILVNGRGGCISIHSSRLCCLHAKCLLLNGPWVLTISCVVHVLHVRNSWCSVYLLYCKIPWTTRRVWFSMHLGTIQDAKHDDENKHRRANYYTDCYTNGRWCTCEYIYSVEWKLGNMAYSS